MEALLASLVTGALMGVYPAINSRRAAREAAAARTIVQGNGHGNVSQMLESVLERQVHMADTLADHTIADSVNFEHLRKLIQEAN